jgi:hypothetical protein
MPRAKLVEWSAAERGVKVCIATMWATLEALGITLRKTATPLFALSSSACEGVERLLRIVADVNGHSAPDNCMVLRGCP